jgi:hypothetical protein
MLPSLGFPGCVSATETLDTSSTSVELPFGDAFHDEQLQVTEASSIS